MYGDWLPRHLLGKCTALCAIIRMIYLAFIILIRQWISFLGLASSADLIFIDGVSAPIPIFSFAGIPVLFYCHFPDKLLCTSKRSVLKQLYRMVIDNVEEATTGCATVIVVNSKFTSNTFQSAFPSLGRSYNPHVLYPTIDISPTDSSSGPPSTIARVSQPSYTVGSRHIFLSLNRYERKKCISLAIDAFALLAQQIQSDSQERLILVIAGGYDSRVTENVDYYVELFEHATNLGLRVTGAPEISDPNHQSSFHETSASPSNEECNAHALRFPFAEVIFRVSISNEERTSLLSCSSALLYTPAHEHFGIVPLEAMYAGIPVIAVNNGGPLETVLHGETGFLCEQTPEAFSEAMLKLIAPVKSKMKGTKLLHDCMAPKCRQHVIENFTSDSMKSKLQEYVDLAAKGGNHKDKRRIQGYLLYLLASFMVLFSIPLAFLVLRVI